MLVVLVLVWMLLVCAVLLFVMYAAAGRVATSASSELHKPRSLIACLICKSSNVQRLVPSLLTSHNCMSSFA
jgi:hypothetical protein